MNWVSDAPTTTGWYWAGHVENGSLVSTEIVWVRWKSLRDETLVARTIDELKPLTYWNVYAGPIAEPLPPVGEQG